MFVDMITSPLDAFVMPKRLRSGARALPRTSRWSTWLGFHPLTGSSKLDELFGILLLVGQFYSRIVSKYSEQQRFKFSNLLGGDIIVNLEE